MPWNRLRTGQSDTRRRQSALRLNPYEDAGNEPDGTGNSTRELDSLPAASPSVSNSIDQGHPLHTSVSQGQDPSSNGQDSPQIKSQRFSMLKFRHASDSQLSRTAREQAMMRAQPNVLRNSSSHHHHRANHGHTRTIAEEKICISTTTSSEAVRWTSFIIVQTLENVAQGQQSWRRS
ncbi:MAG: hypothetical protein Q9221_000243 [Calogaya cf. arnoldii]